MLGLFQDLRFSLRLLTKRPGFAIVTTACLALGIGANAAVFSLLNALLLRDLPLPDAGRLIVLRRGPHSGFSFPDYMDLKNRFANSGELLATLATESSIDRQGHQGQLVTAEAVTGNYARVFRIGTALGDWFDNEQAPTAVISYRMWQRFFHGDPRALGQQVRSETQWYTIIGVAPKDFTGISSPRTTSIWVPLRIWARQHPSIEARLQDRESTMLTVFGRLSAGVTNAAATAELQGLDMQSRRKTVRWSSVEHPITTEEARGVASGGDRASVRTVVGLLFAVVGIVLLICCVNAGNLLLVRGATRQREVAIRYSLGATRGRIMRQFLTDSLVLAVAGGLGGLAVSDATVRLMLWLVPALPLGESIGPAIPLDRNVVEFTSACALASVLLFGLLPAWKSSSIDPATRMKDSAGAPRAVRLRRVSVTAQVTLSFLLLAIAGVFLETCWKLQRANPGFAVRNRLYATTYVSTPELQQDQIPDFYRQVLAKLRSTPNVKSAGLTYLLPLLGGVETECVQSATSGELQASSSTISPRFLRTMSIPLLAGRDFADSDRANGRTVVLISQILAQKLWPGAPAIGREIRLGCRQSSTATVVGVVSNSKTVALSKAAGPHVYLAFAQNASGLANIVIETAASARAFTDSFRRILLEQGYGLRVYAVNELAEHVEESYWQLRWESWLLGAFGVLALLLATLGLYGVTAYSTTLRSKEFGLRIALGAEPSDVLQLVLNEGARMGLTGIGIGLAGGVALMPPLRGYLPGVQSIAAQVYLAIAVLWLAVLLAACYGPARRSAQTEPATVLREE